jgi:hypothetical protein
LEGYDFKPRINKLSRELSSTMKPLNERMIEMLAEREAILEARRKAKYEVSSPKPRR